jgi:hypothetical protein
MLAAELALLAHKSGLKKQGEESISTHLACVPW